MTAFYLFLLLQIPTTDVVGCKVAEVVGCEEEPEGVLGGVQDSRLLLVVEATWVRRS